MDGIDKGVEQVVDLVRNQATKSITLVPCWKDGETLTSKERVYGLCRPGPNYARTPLRALRVKFDDRIVTDGAGRV